ncbi:hypothetical protein L839_0619 [Mycobacterium avium MAV_120809_2495]|nr:hypothetical protein L839_0619 [Mycobacterium avium MAV_120809_2495]
MTKGAPAPHDNETAAAVLADIHRDRDRTAIEVLHRYAGNSDVVAALADQLQRSWRDVRAGPVDQGRVSAPHDNETAAAVLADIHRDRDRTAIEVLHRYAGNSDVVAALADQLQRSWRDVRAGPVDTGRFWPSSPPCWGWPEAIAARRPANASGRR